MIRNQATSFHHIYEPGWYYQAKLELLVRIKVLDSPLPEVNRYLLPGLKPGRNSRQIYGRAAQIPEVPEEYSVD